jgi:hypothetical protein
MVLLLRLKLVTYSESQFITLGDVEKPITLAGNISKSGPSSGVYTYVVTSGGIGGVFGVGTQVY